MTDLREIADEIYNKEKTISSRDFVTNYEKYKDIIEKFDYNESQEKYFLVFQLTADYAMELTKIESYSKALPQLKKAFELFKMEMHTDKEKLDSVKFQESLLWCRGKCNYHLRNYSLSKSDFELLTRQYPDNTIYKQWLTAINNIKLNKIKTILWYYVSGSILISALLNKRTFSKDIFVGSSFLCLIVVVGLEIIIYYRKKKNVA